MNAEDELRFLGADFREILHNVIGKQATVFDYDKKDDFTKLWGADNENRPTILDAVAGKEAIVVIWEGRLPASSDDNAKLLAPHLTPLDWALAFSIRVLDDPSLCGKVEFAIHIVNLTGDAFQDAWAIQMSHQLCANMPWLRLHAPLMPKTGLNEDDGRPEVAAYRKGYQPIVADQLPSDSVNPGAVPKALPLLLRPQNGGCIFQPNSKRLATASSNAAQHCITLKNLAKQWAASLTQSNDHHDINNIIGAHILKEALKGHAKDVAQRADTTHRDAMLRRVWWCRVAPAFGSFRDYTPPAIPPNTRLRVLAVDDQLQNGWSEVLLQLLGAEKGAQLFPANPDDWKEFIELGSHADSLQVFGIPSAEPLIPCLKSANFSERDYGFRYWKPKGHEDVPEVMVLDLRLGSSSTPSTLEKQRKNILALVEIAENLSDQHNLAWPAIDGHELGNIKMWCSSGNKQYEPNALTLLPRLLALATPLTPIILFSSTNRADIKQLLRPYRNVYAAFEKPRALADSETISATLARFREQFQTSLAPMFLGKELFDIVQYGTSVSDKIPTISRTGNNLDIPHVECYFDESGGHEDTNVTESCVVAVYESEQAAQSLHAATTASSFEFSATDNLTLTYATTWLKTGKEGGSCLPMPKHSKYVYEHVLKHLGKHTRRWLPQNVEGPCVDEKPEANPQTIQLGQLCSAAEGSDAFGNYPEVFRNWVGSSRDCKDMFQAKRAANNPDEALYLLHNKLWMCLKEKWNGSYIFAMDNGLERLLTETVSEPYRIGTQALYLSTFGRNRKRDLAQDLQRAFSDKIREILGGLKKSPAIFALHSPVGLAHHSNYLDAALDQQIRMLAEAAIFDVVPKLLGDSKFTYWLFFATRKLTKPKEEPFSQDELKDNFLRWGMLPYYDKKTPRLDEMLHELAIKAQVDSLTVLESFFHRATVSGSQPLCEDQATIAKSVRRARDVLKRIQKSSDTRSTVSPKPYSEDATNWLALPYGNFLNPSKYFRFGNSESYGCSSFGALARAIAHGRAHPDAPALVGAVGVRVNQTREETRIRGLHNIADWAPRLYNEDALTGFPLISMHLEVASGSHAYEGHGALLHACHRADLEDWFAVAQQLLESDWRRLVSAVRKIGCIPLEAFLISKSASGLRLLTGEQLLALSKNMGSSRNSADTPTFSVETGPWALLSCGVHASPKPTVPAAAAYKDASAVQGIAVKFGAQRGKVTRFFDIRGFGFITPEGGGQDVYVLYKEIQCEGRKTLEEGQKVEFVACPGNKGPVARQVRVLQAKSGADCISPSRPAIGPTKTKRVPANPIMADALREAITVQGEKQSREPPRN